MADSALGTEVVLSKSRQFGYHIADGWFSVHRDEIAGDAASISSSMVVEDSDGSESVISADEIPGADTYLRYDGDNTLFSTCGSSFDAVVETLRESLAELEILEEAETTGRRQQYRNHVERLIAEAGFVSQKNNTAGQTWPREVNLRDHLVELEVMLKFSDDCGGPTRNFVPVRELISPTLPSATQLKLARARNAKGTSCPSLWTGSTCTKDTESVAGQDAFRPPSSAETAALPNPWDIITEDIGVFRVSEFEGEALKSLSDRVVLQLEDSPTPLGLGPPLLLKDVKPMAPKLTAPGKRDGDNNPTPISSSPAGSDANTSETNNSEAIDYSSEFGGPTDDGDYWSDYMPDVPYMSDTHIFWQHKDVILATLFECFRCWQAATETAPTDAQQNPPDSSSSTQTPTGRQSQSRNKRDRSDGKQGGRNSSSGSRQGCPQATNSKKPRHGDRPRRPHLACPYYKKAPMQYYHCHSKIISTISHVKQHLSRNHQLPVYCRVCKEIFPNERECDAHAEQQTCQPRTDIVHDGLTKAQKEQLNRRASPTIPEEQQWFEIFDILFPGYSPRPGSAYINAGLVAETENYQDFERVEGPRIILETLRRQGVDLVLAENPEHDLSVIRENLLADALTLMAERWNELRPVHSDGIATELLSDGSGSVAGAAPSTGGGTLVEVQDETTAGNEVFLDDKIVDDGRVEMVLVGDIDTVLSTFPPVEMDDAALFDSSINWPEGDA